VAKNVNYSGIDFWVAHFLKKPVHAHQKQGKARSRALKIQKARSRALKIQKARSRAIFFAIRP